jgi:hypothetical protein
MTKKIWTKSASWTMAPWSVQKKTAWKASPRALSKAELSIEPKMESKSAPKKAAKMARQIAQRRQPPAQKPHRTTLPTSKTEFSKR